MRSAPYAATCVRVRRLRAFLLGFGSGVASTASAFTAGLRSPTVRAFGLSLNVPLLVCLTIPSAFFASA